MSTGTHITEVYDALVALLKVNLAGIAVQSLTDQQFDEANGRLLAKPPAVFLALRDEQLDRRRDHTALTYQSAQTFLAVCGALSLRSTDEQRIGALELLSKVCDVLAGARLTLPSSPPGRAQVALGAVRLAQFDEEGTWYELQFTVDSIAQYSGVAAA